jgi:hypothetical protein
MAGLDPAIHVLFAALKAWMLATLHAFARTLDCHARESGHPVTTVGGYWVPAYTGTTAGRPVSQNSAFPAENKLIPGLATGPILVAPRS